MAIKKNDPVMLDPEALAKSAIRLRAWFPDDADWAVISKLPNSVGLVLSVRTRERQIPAMTRGGTSVEIVQTAEVSWSEGVVKECPVQFLYHV